MTASASAIVGCSYFGARIPRHVARDMEDLARRGFTGVLHTFSENDFAYYRETMGQIVDISHELGLEVQMNPWGVGRTFGGEAESRFVTMRPEACQVLDDGRRVAAGCLNNPIYRSYCKEWADAALEAGADLVFWDEPHWVVPAHVGVDDPTRWSCHCDVCRERFGGPLPAVLTPEALTFREASLVDFLREMVAHVRALGGRNTICVLPAVEGAHGIRDWDAVAALPGVDVFGTDPYWQVFGEPAREFVGRFAALAVRAAGRAGVEPELWVPAFRLTRDDIPDLEAAVDAARGAGIERLWVWGYEACAHMSSLATPDSSAVWEAAVRALTGATTETRREEHADLDLRPTRELVRLMNREDEAVPAAVATAGDAIADAIDAIVERLSRGGRLIYAGAGSSGRLAAVDADECETTFSVSRVIAVVAESDAAEDDEDGGGRALAALLPSEDDAVVAISASGSTLYALGALRAARDAGAFTVALVSNANSPLAALADCELCIPVGPEFIAGSTRLKAGTAQKLVLNMLSTIAFVRLGKTFGNLMVDVAATNEKLRGRVRGIVVAATGVPAARADDALQAAGGSAKVAIVSLLAGIDAEAARGRLAQANDNVRVALETS
jgi:N-acetylmuramic acid 6-phosphate etherase